MYTLSFYDHGRHSPHKELYQIYIVEKETVFAMAWNFDKLGIPFKVYREGVTLTASDLGHGNIDCWKDVDYNFFE